MKKQMKIKITVVLSLISIHSAEAWNGKDAVKRPSDEALRKILTEKQFQITRKDGTEQPFQNEYWNNKEEGIYVDVISGEPLFSSKDKYDSHTGWPSFIKPIRDGAVIEKTDHDGDRTEVRSKIADSHLGHIFKDGPKPTGLRYCMNSAAMRFISKLKLNSDKKYSEFAKIFEPKNTVKNGAKPEEKK